uniref:Uncharacterized protein n=1 Tax=Megaselia scalaris TaxID=36166 RepID=T1GYX5_MEGSC
MLSEVQKFLDGISTLIINKLLPSSINYLTEVYQGPYFRRISPLPPNAKILIPLLLLELQQHLSLKLHQRRFRNPRTTQTYPNLHVFGKKVPFGWSTKAEERKYGHRAIFSESDIDKPNVVISDMSTSLNSFPTS